MNGIVLENDKYYYTLLHGAVAVSSNIKSAGHTGSNSVYN